jgi:hypothetical protein
MHEDDFEPIELPEQELNPIEMLSRFLVESDRREKRMYSEVSRALDFIHDKYGQDGSIAAMNYVQKKEGWDLEILLERYEVENFLMETYNVFDDDIWMKVVGTSAMSEYRRKVFALSRTYLARAVREVLERERPDNSVAGDPLL